MGRLAAAAWLFGLAELAFAAPPGAPGAPTARLDAYADAAFVEFAAPASDGGSPITGYLVEASPAQGYDADYGSLSTTHYFVDLVQGQAYTFTVRATNADGTGPASAPSAPVTVPVIAALTVADASIAEGTGGTTSAQVIATLSMPLDHDLVLHLSAQSTGEATPGVDFKAVTAQESVLPAGATTLAMSVPVYGDAVDESDERFRAIVSVASAGDVRVLDPQATVTILDDDSGRAPLQARPDRLVMSVQSEVQFNPVYNDVFDQEDLYQGRFTLLGQPEEGVVMTWSDSNGYDPTDNVLVWYPPENFVGEVHFDYELCDDAERCSRATVTLVARAPVGYALDYVGRSMGGSTLELSGMPEMAGARYLATAPVAPTAFPFTLGGNVMPERIWDAPASARWVVRTVAPSTDGRPRRVDVFAEALMPGDATPAHLYMGRDANGDGKPSADEVLCVDTSGHDGANCEFGIDQAAGQSVSYWVMVQNVLRDASDTRLNVYEVPDVPSGGAVSVSGPGIVAQGGLIELNYLYEIPGLQAGDRLVSFVHVHDGNGRFGPPAPLLVAPASMLVEAYPLRPGRPLTLRLGKGEAHDGLFFDVPAGAAAFTVTTTSDDEIGLSVLRSTQFEDASTTYVLRNMQSGGLVSANPGGNERITHTMPASGRWFVKLTNSPAAVAEVEVQVTIAATAPVVRQGSYFNPSRPGSGLFLSPAGGEIAGLWYTYFQDNTPTWYYLQGLKPGANGIWTSEIWRSAWSGDSNHLVDVGHAVFTPVGPDKFRFSYVIDGMAGFQAYEALGRGCPSLAGTPVDISSQWFDPRTAGTGYSVQMWAGYEFYAAFIYDREGVPRFLSAETSGFKGATATLQLDQLRGDCPTCSNFAPHTSRQPAGTFSRVISGGTLSNVLIDATFVPEIGGSDPWEGGRWTGDDAVQLLGGPGTTQGCGL